jgi:predicted DNA-binding transcriptional regulator AlpA
MSDGLPLTFPPATEADAVPLLVDARELGKLLRVGLRTVRSWDSGGRLPMPVRIGGAVRWNLEEIRAWVHAGAPDRAAWERIRSAQPKLPAR